MKFLCVIALLLGFINNEGKAQRIIPPMPQPPLPIYHAPLAHSYGVGGSLYMRRGSYQTIDKTWHEAKINLAGDGIWTQDIHDRSEEPERTVVPVSNLHLVVFRTDTLEILSAPADLAVLVENDYAGKQQLQTAVFVKRCLKGAGLELLRCPTTHKGAMELMREQNGRLSIVPQKQKPFQEYALALVGDCPHLRQYLETGAYGVGMMEPMLRQYVHWRQSLNR